MSTVNSNESLIMLVNKTLSEHIGKLYIRLAAVEKTSDKVTKLEEQVKSLCSLVHYLIKEPDFYEELKAAEPFNIATWPLQQTPFPSPEQIWDEAAKNNLRVDRERHLKTVGIHLTPEGKPRDPNGKPYPNKFSPSPKF